ncbi:MAG: hypothetical protein KF916_06830 [Microbacteriaceae bacterium]|nr:hypothetical protein [Microbacteriaceae bacterium]
MKTVVIQPRSGKITAIVVAAFALAAAIISISADPANGWRSIFFLVLISFLAWWVFWTPRIDIAEKSALIVNVFSRVSIPYPRIKLVDTRYALALTTDRGRFVAWAAPAPSQWQMMRAKAEDAKHLPETTYVDGTVRPGDLISSDSGQAAYLIRREFEKREEITSDTPPVVRTWHIWQIVVTVALVVATVLVNI